MSTTSPSKLLNIASLLSDTAVDLVLIAMLEKGSSFEVEVDDDTDNDYYVRGTIVKAKPDQTRFKLKSMWVSLGDGTYKHLTGKKGLITTHERLADYTDVVFQA